MAIWRTGSQGLYATRHLQLKQRSSHQSTTLRKPCYQWSPPADDLGAQPTGHQNSLPQCWLSKRQCTCSQLSIASWLRGCCRYIVLSVQITIEEDCPEGLVGGAPSLHEHTSSTNLGVQNSSYVGGEHTPNKTSPEDDARYNTSKGASKADRSDACATCRGSCKRQSKGAVFSGQCIRLLMG